MNSQVRAAYEEMMTFLDRQEEHVGRMLDLLTELRAALIRHDEQALHKIQTMLAEEAHSRVLLDAAQKALQKKTAEAVKIPADEVCISAVSRHLDAKEQKELAEKQELLRGRIALLQKEHLATELLLRECARMNRRLLEVIVGSSGQSKTYDSRGRSAWQAPGGLMSMKM